MGNCLFLTLLTIITIPSKCLTSVNTTPGTLSFVMMKKQKWTNKPINIEKIIKAEETVKTVLDQLMATPTMTLSSTPSISDKETCSTTTSNPQSPSSSANLK